MNVDMDFTISSLGFVNIQSSGILLQTKWNKQILCQIKLKQYL